MLPASCGGAVRKENATCKEFLQVARKAGELSVQL